MCACVHAGKGKLNFFFLILDNTQYMFAGAKPSKMSLFHPPYSSLPSLPIEFHLEPNTVQFSFENVS